MRTMYLFLFLFASFAVSAQDELAEDSQDAEYLDSFLKECKKRHAEYVRRVEKNGLGRFMATTISVYGDTVFIGEYSDPSCITPHGRFAYFHDNGELESRGYYRSGRKVGTWKHFKRDGSPKPFIKYSENIPEELLAAEKKEVEEIKEAEQASEQFADPEALAAAEAAMNAAQAAEAGELADVQGEIDNANIDDTNALQAETNASLVSEEISVGTNIAGEETNSLASSKAASSAQQEPSLDYEENATATPRKFNQNKQKNFGLPMVW